MIELRNRTWYGGIMYTKYNLIIALISLPIVIMMAISLCFYLRNKSKKTQLLPFIMIAGLLITLEIAKQIIGISRESGYNYFFIPLHICSIFLYSLSFATFFKQDSKISHIGWSVTYFVGLIVMVVMLFAPYQVIGQQSQSLVTGIRQDSLLIDLHSIIYHYIVVLAVLLMFMLRPYQPKIKDYIKGSLAFLIFLLLSLTVATILQVNFADFRQSDLIGIYDFGTNAIWVQILRVIGYISVSWIAILILCLTPKIYNLLRKQKRTY